MLAVRITFAHFSVSSAMSFPKSSGEPAIVMPPKSASRSFSLGSARPALNEPDRAQRGGDMTILTSLRGAVNAKSYARKLVTA